MKKLVINATQGGAKIKGAKQMLLQDVIKKYCKEPIDKTKINSLLSPAEDGDELIEKVIPLLKDDIENLKEIIKQSKKGLAANRGLKTLMKRKKYKKLLKKKKEIKYEKHLNFLATKFPNNSAQQMIEFYEWSIKNLRKCRLKTILTLSYKNFVASENAHIASKMNPLVNVTIYGVSRQIQGRDLKVDGTITNFLKNPSDALIRIKRNTLILKTAKKAAISLLSSYNKTYELLKEYNKTKDSSLLINQEDEEINFDDAETYFEAGNWAHPLVDALKLLDYNSYCMENDLYIDHEEDERAVEILDKAVKMREDAIQKAKDYEDENSDRERKLLEYNELIEESKRIGREEQDFETALKMIKKACDLMPDETEARWGLATAYHHSGEVEKSLEEYKKLIEDFPDNHMFQFEYGQVLLTHGKTKEGLIEITDVMNKTEEYDQFYAILGDIYSHAEMHKEAIEAYDKYLEKFSFDFKIWYKEGKSYSLIKDNENAVIALSKCREIKPDYKKSEIKRLLIQLEG